MTRKAKVILASMSVICLSIVLTACGSLSKYDSKKSISNQMSKQITGIDAWAGEMNNTRNALKDYGLDKTGWQLQPSSSTAMVSQLDKAYHNKKPIIVTSWQPHWMFKKYNLKFLQDPKLAYGKSEHISTITHKGFNKQNPGAYKLLKQFHWNQSDISDVMLKVNNGEDPAKAAKEFINSNPKLIAQWTKDVPKGKGQLVRLNNINWDSEIASTNVISQVLQKMGYKTETKTLEPQPMYVSIVNESADASVSSWLPVSQGQYLAQQKDKIDVANNNLDGAKTGLVVPKYMTNVNSINDLKK